MKSTDTDAIRIVCSDRCQLGEGPAWDELRQTLNWVDILGDAVHVMSLRDGVRKSWRVCSSPSAAIPMWNGNLIVPAGRSVLELDPRAGNCAPVMELVSEPAHNRSNDAKCDPAGRLWIGTMDSRETSRTGRLWRLDSAEAGSVVLEGIGISNTLAWDRRRGRFYFADSLAGEIYVFDYSARDGNISNKQLFFGQGLAPGVPDGSAIDEDGYLWNARWDGGCLVRISPSAKVDRVVKLPLDRPTSCAFGGDDMRTLFVTSASPAKEEGRSPETLDGMLIALELETRGARIPFCGGTDATTAIAAPKRPANTSRN